MAVRSVTARLYDEERNWGQTLHNAAINIDEDTGEIADISYDFRLWRWSHTDSISGEQIYVFVPRDPNEPTG